ncbi:hypothetical protein EZV62_019162 [Acer yangbiense]|uniref:CCHC-type domain-containing protein n=1 Tax=Acer yangbiense TaxID=1000413 RepID=A0A5C7HCJ7_9ROSI|nr:hypothetical protein EZV62_019162 [Acer yangbiense]
MKTLLLSEGLWNIVNNGFTEPTEESRLSGPEKAKLEADQMTDAMPFSKIQNGVTATIFPRIMRAITAKQAWEILEREFQGDNKAKVIKLQTFRREFENLKMKEFESVKEYFSRVIGVVNHMRTLGEDVTDQKVVEKILISLPEKYEHIVAAIEESKDLTTLSVEQLMGSLESHEQRRLLRNDQSVESAFQTKLNLKQQKSFKKSDQQRGDRRKWNKGESSKKEDNRNHRDYVADDSKPASKICKKKNHDTSNCWHRGKPPCFNCKKFGHVEKDCRYKQNANQAKKENDEEGTLFYACQSAVEEKDSTWHLDSGCSNHMSGNENIFLDVDSTVTPKVKLGNGAIVESKGKGGISVETKKGTKYVNDVLFVPELNQNLLSVGQLVENGYRLHFEDGGCTIFDKKEKDLVIAYVQMKRNRNFSIDLHCGAIMALKSEVVQDTWLWHKRFCHLNFNGLKLLKHKNMVKGLSEIESVADTCEGCIMGKQHRISFPRQSSWRARAPLELVHTDICGQMRTPSISQQRTKFDEKSKKSIFVGYSSYTKGYRLYDVEIGKLIVSRDVIFDEKTAWDWKEKKELEQPPVILQSQDAPLYPASSSSLASSSTSSHSSSPVTPQTRMQMPGGDFQSSSSSARSSSSRILSPESPPRNTRLLSDLYQTQEQLVDILTKALPKERFCLKELKHLSVEGLKESSLSWICLVPALVIRQSSRIKPGLLLLLDLFLQAWFYK